MPVERRPELPWNRPRTVLTYSRETFRRRQNPFPPLGMRWRIGIGVGAVIFFGAAVEVIRSALS